MTENLHSRERFGKAWIALTDGDKDPKVFEPNGSLKGIRNNPKNGTAISFIARLFEGRSTKTENDVSQARRKFIEVVAPDGTSAMLSEDETIRSPEDEKVKNVLTLFESLLRE